MYTNTHTRRRFSQWSHLFWNDLAATNTWNLPGLIRDFSAIWSAALGHWRISYAVSFKWPMACDKRFIVVLFTIIHTISGDAWLENSLPLSLYTDSLSFAMFSNWRYTWNCIPFLWYYINRSYCISTDGKLHELTVYLGTFGVFEKWRNIAYFVVYNKSEAIFNATRPTVQ